MVCERRYRFKFYQMTMGDVHVRKRYNRYCTILESMNRER